MTLQNFINTSNLLRKSEIEKTALLAYYNFKKLEVMEFGLQEIKDWLHDLNLPAPNLSRLQKNITKSNKFIKGSKPKTYKLHANQIVLFDKEYPEISDQNEEVVCIGTLLSSQIYEDTINTVESLAKQINASYENNIFDGCAVLMRRLLELLLILSYEKFGIQNEIKDANNDYFLLNGIANNAKTNTVLSLSRNTKFEIHKYKKLGNYSAHKLYYNCTKQDIDNIAFDYRATIEELLYKSGIRK